MSGVGVEKVCDSVAVLRSGGVLPELLSGFQLLNASVVSHK